MTRGLFEAWSPAAAELDVDLRGPARYPLAGGAGFEAEMLFVDFGNLHGTAAVSDPAVAERLRPMLEGRLRRRAGGAVELVELPPEGVTPTGYQLAQLLRTWGWAGSEKGRPAYM
jgi:hypothetical protein